MNKKFGRVLKIGVNSYVNNLPLKCAFGKKELSFEYELDFDNPASLSKKCEKNLLDISSISLWRYPYFAKNYELLPEFCISAKGAVKSVKIFSKYKIEGLGDKEIFITSESGSSSSALRYYFKKRFNKDIFENKAHDILTAGCVFLIGDNALKFDASMYDYVYDFGELWEDFFKTPIVYAGIVVRRELADSLRKELIDFCDFSLNEFNVNRDYYYDYALQILANSAMSKKDIKEYFEKLEYKIPQEHFDKTLEMASENGNF